MAKYKFPKESMIGILMHVEAFDAIVQNLTPVDGYYLLETDIVIEPDQLEHLMDQYGLEVIV